MKSFKNINSKVTVDYIIEQISTPEIVAENALILSEDANSNPIMDRINEWVDADKMIIRENGNNIDDDDLFAMIVATKKGREYFDFFVENVWK